MVGEAFVSVVESESKVLVFSHPVEVHFSDGILRCSVIPISLVLSRRYGENSPDEVNGVCLFSRPVNPSCTVLSVFLVHGFVEKASVSGWKAEQDLV